MGPEHVDRQEPHAQRQLGALKQGAGNQRRLMQTGVALENLAGTPGQFDILEHGLCWVHTERLVHKLIPSNAAQAVGGQVLFLN